MKNLLVLFVMILSFTGCGVNDGVSYTAGGSAPQLDFHDGQAAFSVIGQTDFVSNASASSQNGLGWAYAVDVDSYGVVRVADYTHNRVMGYLEIPTTPGPAAAFVLGQPDFTSSSLGTVANKFKSPTSGTTANGKYFLSDYMNHRVLVYNSLPTFGNPNADIALGASSPAVAGTQACTASGLSQPSQTIVHNGKVFVADYGHKRILIYNSIPTTSNQAADLVLGQVDFTTCNGISPQTNIGGVTSIWTDGTKLVAADDIFNRVLIWNTMPTINNQAPDLVLGQPSLSVAGVNTGGLSATSMSQPIAVVADTYGKLFVSELGNNRVLIWDSFPTYNQQPADHVLGQPGMTTNSAPNPPTASSLSTPGLLTFSGPYLLVGDTFNNRVLIFKSNSAN